MFTDKDLKQFSKKNIKAEIAEKQIENFKKGFPFINIVEAATDKHGIIKLSDNRTIERKTPVGQLNLRGLNTHNFSVMRSGIQELEFRIQKKNC